MISIHVSQLDENQTRATRATLFQWDENNALMGSTVLISHFRIPQNQFVIRRSVSFLFGPISFSAGQFRISSSPFRYLLPVFQLLVVRNFPSPPRVVAKSRAPEPVSEESSVLILSAFFILLSSRFLPCLLFP